MLCIEFDSHKFDKSILVGVVHILKAITILTGEQWNLSTLFVVSHFSSTKVSPGRRLKLDSRKSVPFPLNRGVSSTEVTNIKIMWTFFRDQILCPPNGGVPWIDVSQRRSSTVLLCSWEKTNCIVIFLRQNRDIVVSWIPEVFFSCMRRDALVSIASLRASITILQRSSLNLQGSWRIFTKMSLRSSEGSFQDPEGSSYILKGSQLGSKRFLRIWFKDP